MSKEAKNRRRVCGRIWSAQLPIYALGLLLALLMAGCGASGAGSSGSTPASTGTAQTTSPPPTQFRQEAAYDPEALTLKNLVKQSDIVVVGKIVKVDPARWNNAANTEWTPTQGTDNLPLVYTTFYVEPEQILKGTPKWGEPIAFRTVGGTATGMDTPVDRVETGNLSLRVGDRIFLLGTSKQFYGSEPVYQPADAYWLTLDENGVWALQDDEFVNQGFTKNANEKKMKLKDIVAAIQALSAE